MNWLKENKIYGLLIYTNILFILALVKICYKIQGFSYLYITVLMVGSFFFYWIIHSILRKVYYKLIFVFTVFGVIGFFYINNKSFSNNILNSLLVDKAIYINSLVAGSQVTNFSDFKFIFLATLPIIVFIILFLTTKGFSNIILIFNFASVVTLWYFGYTEEIKERLFAYLLISLITYCINSYLSNVRKLSKKGIKIGIGGFKILIYTLGASILIAGLTNYLPQDYSGKYSSDIRSRFYNKFSKPVETGEEKGKKLQYDLSYSGYDNNKKRLGGPIVINKLIAFRVQSDEKHYLKGIVKDFYDGFSWDQSEKKYNLKDSQGSQNLFMDNFSRGLVGNIANIIIYPEELNTTTMFTTNVFVSAVSDKGEIYYDSVPNIINSVTLRNPYTVNYYKLNSSGENLKSLGKVFNQREMSAFLYRKNYSKYLQVPENISARVYDLVYNLVKDKQTNADKINAITSYLKKNYPYTLEVSEVPEGQEFLDYFLFTERKGYCTYFATAETIMCRIAGIPARYVEGFNMSNEKDDKGLYVVRNENAHAWSEVLYVNEIGNGLWYEVDAVPNAVDIIHKQDENKEQPSSPNAGSNLNSNTKPSKNNLLDEQDLSGSVSGMVIPLWIMRMLLIFTIVIVLNLILISYEILLKRRLVKCPSIIPIYKYSLKRIGDTGLKSSEYLGDLEFIDNFPSQIRETVNKAAQLAYAEYFGGKSPTQFNKQEYYEFIEGYVKKNHSRIEYFAKKYYFISKISLIKKRIMLIYKSDPE